MHESCYIICAKEVYIQAPGTWVQVVIDFCTPGAVDDGWFLVTIGDPCRHGVQYNIVLQKKMTQNYTHNIVWIIIEL